MGNVKNAYTGKDLKMEKDLTIGILLTGIFLILEVVGGWISGSLSLLSDAGHMFRDVLALLLSKTALDLSRKLPTPKRTFGYHRTETLAALINGILLLGMSFWIFREAILRFLHPRPIKSETMLVIAFLGLIINIYVAFRLKGSRDLNIKSAYWHVLSDAISSLGVILASIIIFLTGKILVDPLLSVLIGIIIVIGSVSIIRESIRVILEFTPRGINFEEVVHFIEGIRGVEGVHNVHIWSLCPNVNILDAHIYTGESNLEKIEEIKQEIKDKLNHYNIKYTTLEFESQECSENGQIRQIEH